MKARPTKTPQILPRGVIRAVRRSDGSTHLPSDRATSLHPLHRTCPNGRTPRGVKAATFRIPEGTVGTAVPLSDGTRRLMPTRRLTPANRSAFMRRLTPYQPTVRSDLCIRRIHSFSPGIAAQIKASVSSPSDSGVEGATVGEYPPTDRWPEGPTDRPTTGGTDRPTESRSDRPTDPITDQLSAHDRLRCVGRTYSSRPTGPGSLMADLHKTRRPMEGPTPLS